MKTKSIVTKYDSFCFYCGRPVETEHHLLFGTGMRQLAEEDGIKLPACGEHHVTGAVICRVHDNPMAEKLSKMFGQAIYERNVIASGEVKTIDAAREMFRKRYGQCFY